MPLKNNCLVIPWWLRDTLFVMVFLTARNSGSRNHFVVVVVVVSVSVSVLVLAL